MIDTYTNGDNDQPITCTQCGVRTDWVNTENDKSDELHTCPNCGYQFTMEYEEPEISGYSMTAETYEILEDVLRGLSCRKYMASDTRRNLENKLTYVMSKMTIIPAKQD